jgi:hypothetical protein
MFAAMILAPIQFGIASVERARALERNVGQANGTDGGLFLRGGLVHRRSHRLRSSACLGKVKIQRSLTERPIIGSAVYRSGCG